jgi:hypothetical protein
MATWSEDNVQMIAANLELHSFCLLHSRSGSNSECTQREDRQGIEEILLAVNNIVEADTFRRAMQAAAPHCLHTSPPGVAKGPLPARAPAPANSLTQRMALFPHDLDHRTFMQQPWLPIRLYNRITAAAAAAASTASPLHK